MPACLVRRLRSDQPRNFLVDELRSELDDEKRVWFMRAYVPPRFSLVGRDGLNGTYYSRWIGQGEHFRSIQFLLMTQQHISCALWMNVTEFPTPLALSSVFDSQWQDFSRHVFNLRQNILGTTFRAVTQEGSFWENVHMNITYCAEHLKSLYKFFRFTPYKTKTAWDHVSI
jgi:hypothetical protein